MTPPPVDRPLRVLITGPDIRQAGGAGVSQHIRYLIEAFSNDPGFALTAFPITSVKSREAWLWKGLRTLFRYAQLLVTAPGFDVVHVNTSIDDRSIVRDTGTLLVCAAVRRKVVLEFHGGDLDGLRRSRVGSLGLLARRALRSARVVLFLSRDQAGPVTREFGLERVRLVANYVPVGEYGAEAPPHEGLRVLFMGRLHSDKGALESVEGFRQARRDGWELVVAGSGPEEGAVRQAVDATDGARFAGFVGGEVKAELLAWGDVFVLPTAHSEGMPYGVLEAAASGMALVASTRAGLSELVRDGTTGIAVAPLDAAGVATALRTLGEDPERLARMQRCAREMVATEYSLPAGHDAFAEIYRDVARNRQG